MKFTTENVNANGTSLQGYVDCSYQTLVRAFGEPCGTYDDYKSDAEWTLKFEDGTVATIYNWKNGKNYCGQAGTPTKDIKDWNIGGNSIQAVLLVKQALGLE